MMDEREKLLERMGELTEEILAIKIALFNTKRIFEPLTEEDDLLLEKFIKFGLEPGNEMARYVSMTERKFVDGRFQRVPKSSNQHQ
jgi:hypothetical protein